MLADDNVNPSGPDLNWTIERRIMYRTWGRIRHLRVEATPDRVIVGGAAPSYYLKQLALAAVSETLAGLPHDPILEVDIEVKGPAGMF